MSRSPIAGVLFQRLWEIWPNKTAKESGRKALEVLLKTEDIDHERLLLSASAYLAKQDSRYIHEVGNWLRNNVWKDYYLSDPAAILEHELRLRESAQAVIKRWNETKRVWWLSIRDEAGALETVKAKLREPYFSDNWSDALAALRSLFYHKNQRFRNITPSLRWFCSGDTVAKILEGEYGVYRKTSKLPRPIGNFQPKDYEEQFSEDFLDGIAKQVAEFTRGLEQDQDGDRQKDSGGMPGFF